MTGARYPGDMMVEWLILLVTILVPVVGIAVVTGIVLLIVKATQQRRVDASAPRLRAEALVLDKRTEITGGGDRMTSQQYFVTFEFPDGNRAELSVSGTESGMLSPGDRGTLEWQGRQFVGFAREILR